MVGESEMKLLIAAAEGDNLAFESLVRRYEMRLRRDVEAYLRRKLRPESAPLLAADDVLQEAYVAAYERLKEFEFEKSGLFYHWLFAIAKNMARDGMKRLGTQKRGGQQKRVATTQVDKETSRLVDILQDLAVTSHTPSRSAMNHEAATAVARALEQMPAEYSEALRLRYVEQMPVAEMAEKLGRTIGAVHQLCHRALGSLRDTLGQDVRGKM